jgi:hypothetical protein
VLQTQGQILPSSGIFSVLQVVVIGNQHRRVVVGVGSFSSDKFAYLPDTLGFTLGNGHGSWGFREQIEGLLALGASRKEVAALPVLTLT